jgi:four helix bundle protein
MASGFRNLVLYRRVMELTWDVYRWVDGWPATERGREGDQLVRAITAVGAHIAEAGGRVTKADRRRILGFAKSELIEVEHWLEIAEHLRLIEPGTEPRTDEISRMLHGLMENPGRT